MSKLIPNNPVTKPVRRSFHNYFLIGILIVLLSACNNRDTAENKIHDHPAGTPIHDHKNTAVNKKVLTDNQDKNLDDSKPNQTSKENESAPTTSNPNLSNSQTPGKTPDSNRKSEKIEDSNTTKNKFNQDSNHTHLPSATPHVHPNSTNIKKKNDDTKTQPNVSIATLNSTTPVAITNISNLESDDGVNNKKTSETSTEPVTDNHTTHSHSQPGTAGAVLEKKLEKAIADEGSIVGGGYMSGLNAHGKSEGLTLASSENIESVYKGGKCSPSAPIRSYNILAINVEITLNRFLDFDPEGRMYVLEKDLQRVREEEAKNLKARLDLGEPGVSIGLGNDAIQPLTIRANQGDCLIINLENRLEENEPASLHIHGSSLYISTTGDPAIATNPDSIIEPGSNITYMWMVTENDQEGIHYFHSHGIERFQAGHGLFGAIVIEQKGSTYENPEDGTNQSTGWTSIIRNPNGSDFREFVLYYHEIGSERYRHLDKNAEPVTFIDEMGGAYKPGGRAMNYRSEPFLNRLNLQEQRLGNSDQSMAYSSYTFGDPATPIARSYLGDPVKTRLVHGGSEVFHVHHTHGGAIRWRKQPGTEDTDFDSGLTKSPNLKTAGSTRLDSQSIGPSESYDLESECGSGGCQQSVGDYLIHCHVAHHYIAGMWMIWRVYNTLQTDSSNEYELGSLRELPDRENNVIQAVNSEFLIGKTVSWKGTEFRITAGNLSQWVETQLPPQGVSKSYDASALNWIRNDNLYLNEPETEKVWPNFQSEIPGARYPILFDPNSGKLAYPLLRPHLGKRPPFAPNHGPAPFLSPHQTGRDPPKPGGNGLDSLCPAGTNLKEFVIHAINLPIVLNEHANLIDPVGQLFVLQEDEAAIRGDNNLRIPLTIRANAGEDCIDIVFKSKLKDTAENDFFSKVNMHIHLVQFDIQASDGVSTGFAYEQSVRPFTEVGQSLANKANAGDLSVILRNPSEFHAGTLVGVGMDQGESFEIKKISKVEGKRLFFDKPLLFRHSIGEIISNEFVRYRWFPDVQFGTAYFHDHVDALTSWKHGLFGALISEPPGSTYHDPYSGLAVKSGNIVDIHTKAEVSPDLTGSFREMVTFIQDNNLTTHIGRSSGSALNLRAQPLEKREGDPSLWFSSIVHGDPPTPVLNTYLGDPVIMRTMVSATNDTHTWHVDGHWFRGERFSSNSKPISTVHIGISERADLIIPAAGGPQQMPGDYLFYNGRTFKLREGSWGILRVHDSSYKGELQTLPGRRNVPVKSPTLCPPRAPVKHFDVSAIQIPLPMLEETDGKIFALKSDIADFISGKKPITPLVLRINVGDCITVKLNNKLPKGRVSFHADMVAYDPLDSMGINAGFNPEQSIGPGEDKKYTFYAHPQYGESVGLVRDWGNVLLNPGIGLYGAIIIGPKGSKYTDPVTGLDSNLSSNWKANVQTQSGEMYRDFALFIQDEDEVIGTHLMPYSHSVEGTVAINYHNSPLEGRFTPVPDMTQEFDPILYSDSSAPVLETYAGDNIKIHVLVPFSEQNHVFSIEGHSWPLEPRMEGSYLVSSIQIGGTETITISPMGGAGGKFNIPGDYLYGDHRLPYKEAGLWGILRVRPKNNLIPTLMPLVKR